jgi:hypothetical protein
MTYIQNKLHRQTKLLFCPLWPLLIGVRAFFPKIFSARFFSSVNAFAGAEPTFINLNFKLLRNVLTCVSLRSMPVNFLIFAAASPIERGGFSEKYCSIVPENSFKSICG